MVATLFLYTVPGVTSGAQEHKILSIVFCVISVLGLLWALIYVWGIATLLAPSCEAAGHDALTEDQSKHTSCYKITSFRWYEIHPFVGTKFIIICKKSISTKGIPTTT